jgi:hypothetical protein
VKRRQVSGRGIPVIGNDVDTDRIIPARFLKAVTFEGMGEHAPQALRPRWRWTRRRLGSCCTQLDTDPESRQFIGGRSRERRLLKSEARGNQFSAAAASGGAQRASQNTPPP